MKSLGIFVLCLYFWTTVLAHPPCGNEYGQTPCLYVPALPQQTPVCASPGSTFCEKVGGYPDNLIKTLLKNYQRDIITDEAKVEFEAKKSSYEVHGYYSPGYGPFVFPEGDKYGSGKDENHHFHKNFHGPRPSGFRNGHHGGQHGYHLHSSGKPGGYHYPSPGLAGSSSSNFFQTKPSSYEYSDFYHRSRKRRENDASEVSDEFIKSISPNRTRRQISPNREQLCEVRSSYINPQAALNSKGNWKYIVNGAETATQLVRTETCAASECSNLCQLPNNYNSRCEQKYVQKRLIALDASGEKLYSDTFWFPSCCVCTLSNTE